MKLTRRSFLTAASAAAVTPFFSARFARAAEPAPIFWVHVQGTGGWDQALFCDPKPSVRAALTADQREIRMAGAIPYLAFADFGQTAQDGFFARNAQQLCIFNGIDTGTNNHTVGEAYCASGSTVPDYPAWAAQVAAVYGHGEPMPFISHGGYDRTGGLLAQARIPEGSENMLTRLGQPQRDAGGEPFLSDTAVGLVRAAHQKRLARQLAAARLPDRKRDLAALLAARQCEGLLEHVEVPGYDPDATNAGQKLRLAMSAFQAGLTTSLSLSLGPFDTHDANDANQATVIAYMFRVLDEIMTRTQAASIPCVVLATSDFGRTPHYTGSGTDHHPIASILVLANAAARATSLDLPFGSVVGGTTDGDATQALQARRIDPRTLRFDDSGIIPTPGHVLRVMRRVAKIDTAPELDTFPLSVGEDLGLG